MIFTPISSSSAGNLYLLEDGDGHTLAIECGLRYSEMAKRLNYRVTGLDGVLLSHAHGDHSRAAKEVLHAGVDIYGLAETFQALKLAGHHNARAIEPFHPFTIKGRWRVLPFDLRHDIATIGFLVRVGEERLLYVTDTAFVPHRFRGVTIIAIEANYSVAILRESDENATRKIRALRYHMSIERVLTFLSANDLTAVREIFLLHLSDEHSNANAFKSAVMAETGKPTYIASK